MTNKGNVLWLCSVCDKVCVSENAEAYCNDSRVVKIDIPQSSDKNSFEETDYFEFKDACIDCRMKISNAVYETIEGINPKIYA